MNKKEYKNIKKNEDVRKVLTQRDLLKGVFLDQYQIEQMRIDHNHFKNLTVELRQIYDKMRLQCNETTNMLAYRIFLVVDAADIDYPEAELETILKRYQRFWPYEPIDFEVQEDPNADVPKQSSYMILKNLEKLENTGKISEEQKKKLIRQKRK